MSRKDVSLEQRFVLKFISHQGVKPTEILKQLKTQFRQELKCSLLLEAQKEPNTVFFDSRSVLPTDFLHERLIINNQLLL